MSNAVDNVELKPCPFCGETNLYIFSRSSRDGTIEWFILSHPPINGCGTRMMDSNRSELVHKWNTRFLTKNDSK